MHNPFFFSYKDPDTWSFDFRELQGYKKGNIEIRLVRFTNGTNHKSANKATIQLDPFEFYDTKFKTHIAIMGDYLVVLLAHNTVSGFNCTAKSQTLYFVDWVKGHVIHVRTPPTTFESFSKFQCSLVEMAG